MFALQKNQTTVWREILAGITTFFTVAYVLLVIPALLGETGMDPGSVLVATSLTAAYASFIMGAVANYPFVLGPGIAMCVYFTYSIVLKEGHPWPAALGLVFLAGSLLLLLNLLRIRQLIIQAIPLSLRIATTAGLGLLIAFVGLKNAGVIVSHPITFLAFSHPLSANHVLTATGLIIIGVLLFYRIPGAYFLGILGTWLLALFFDAASFQGFFSWPSSMLPTLFQLDVKSAFDVTYLGPLISLLFVTLFDSTGTLVGLAEEGGFLREHPSKTKMCCFPRVTRALMPDTTGTLVASMLGTSPTAVYIESAAGMSVGGKTGLTAVTAAFLFLIALFFTPFASSVPPFAIAPALVVIGGLMLKVIVKMDWADPTEWVPGFATFILIPLTLSIANGIAVGYITHCLLKLLTGKGKEVHWLSWILAALFILKFALFP